MNKRILISVLIPAYNAEKTLRQALWSAVNQDIEEKEIIVYLDGCSDHSARIAHAFKDFGVRVVESQENKGIVHARNTLVSLAKGKYLAWLDADDLWLPTKLSKQLHFMEQNPEIEVLGTWCEVRNSKRIRAVQWPNQPRMLDAWLLFRNPLVQSSLLIRQTAKATYDASFEYLEDYAFVTSKTGGGKVAILPEILCSYLEATQNGKVDKYLKYDFIRKAEQLLELQLGKIGLKYGKNHLSLLREFLSQNHTIKQHDGLVILGILKDCNAANIQQQLVQHRPLKWVLYLQYLRLFKLCKGLRLRLLPFIVFHPLGMLAAIIHRPRYIKRKA